MNPEEIAEFKYDGTFIRLHTFGHEDHISRIVLSQKTFYELDVLTKAQEIYIPQTAIIDVGGNIGNHTVFFAKILGAMVYAFEPHPPSFQILSRNILENSIGDLVKAYPIGLGERYGRGNTILPSSANVGQAQLVEDGNGLVEIKPLDDFEIPSPIGLVKIDVEGQECAVLRGARRLLRQHRPDVLVEAATDDDFKDVLELMLPLGFIPRARYAWTPTFLFSHKDQVKRFQHYLRTWKKPPQRFSLQALFGTR